MNVLELGPGLYPDVPASDYHVRILGLASNSALLQVERAPRVYRAWVEGQIPDRDTEALFFGKALHCAVFEEDAFVRDYVVMPDFGDCRFKGPKAERDAWRKENRGKLVLSPEDATRIAGMRAALYRDEMAGPIIRAAGHNEITCRWRDPETDLQCKARGDRWAPSLRALADLKSCDDARGAAFRRSCEVYGYDKQEAFYRRGWGLVDEPIESFPFIACEKAYPHLVAVYEIDPKSIEEADEANRANLRLLADCLAKNEWPGLPARIQTLHLRPWRLER